MEGTIITSLSRKCTTPDARKHTQKHSLFVSKTHGRAFRIYKCSTSGTAPPGIGARVVLLNCSSMIKREELPEKLTYTEDEENYPRKA